MLPPDVRFEAKMHQIRFLLPLTAFKRPKVTEGKEEGREREGKERGGMVASLIEDSRSGNGGGEGEKQGGELGLGRPCTSFFHCKHCVEN